MSEASAALERYTRERERLIAEATPGLEAARALSKATDEAVAALAAAASDAISHPVAILAMGGYGTGRLFPASDIDLLLVTTRRSREVQPYAREVFYPLWDAGLEVGHQVRTPREHSRAARDDITALTATLTARIVAGDQLLGERVLVDTAAWAQRHSSRITADIQARDRPGYAYLLEPDLKSGAGGQRDIDELTWLAATLTGGPKDSPRGLLDVCLLDETQAARLAAAQAVLAAARWRLHVAGVRPTQVMTLEAAGAGRIDAPAVQRALADVHNTLLAVRRRYRGAPMDCRDWSPEQVFDALGRGDESIPDLEGAAWAGLLESVLPGIRERMVLRRPGLSHRLTVGAHSIRAATALVHAEGDAFAARLLHEIHDLRPLQIAALAHDFGKDQPGTGHAERGAEVGARIALEVGLSPPLAWGVATLVREHLLLSQTVAHRDLSDEDVIMRAAARLGDRSLVGPLYLLTRADMRATGPDAWTPWRASLVSELAEKLRATLSDEVDGAGIASRADGVRTAALKLAGAAGMERSALRFLEEVPLRYLATREPHEVLRHARLASEVRGPLGHDRLALDVAPGSALESWRVTVVARDREGLFARIAGVLGLADLDILAAEAFTETSGVAIDVFTVTGASMAKVDHDRWARVERLLRAALVDRLDVTARLTERRRHYSARSRGDVRVRFDEEYPLATAVHVDAPDRVGLLHDVAAALHANGLDIRLATAESQGGRVRDVFHVIDRYGDPPRDRAVLDKVSRDIEAALG